MTALVSNDLAIPATVPHYTAEGVPFAYPPFVFYVIAIIHNVAQIEIVTAFRLYPLFSVPIGVAAVFYLANSILESRRRAATVALVVASSPTIFHYHLTGAGVVRGTGFLWTVIGLYAGVRQYKYDDRMWLMPAGVAFGLVTLTHPSYALFFTLSYLFIFGYFGRSLTGFGDGVIVAAIGFLLSSPWWMTVGFEHGFSVFFEAMTARPADTGYHLSCGLARLWLAWWCDTHRKTSVLYTGLVRFHRYFVS
jgi:hypothetical protein